MPLKNTRISFILVLICSLLISNVSHAASTCTTGGTIIFINGVDKKDFQQVKGEAETLGLLMQEKGVVGIGKVAYLHNPSDGVFFDVIGELTNQIVTQRKVNFADTFLQVGMALWGHVADLTTSDKTLISARLAYFVSQASLDYTSLYSGKVVTAAQLVNQFKDTIAVELTNGSKVVLVAHSQGNFFANDAYTAVVANLPVEQSRGLAVANIANPASKAATGLYATAYQDLIIIAARVQTALLFSQQPMPANTDATGANDIDPDGHGFVKVYLSRILPTGTTDASSMASRVVSLIQQGINFAVDPPVPLQCRPIAPICPDTFTQTQLAQVKPGMTVAQVNSIFGCPGKTSPMSNWYMWYNANTLISLTLNTASVNFINGVYTGMSPDDKSISGTVIP